MGRQQGKLCRPFAVFGITSRLSPDCQHVAWQSRLPESEWMNTRLEKKEFLFCGKRGSRNGILSQERMCLGQAQRITAVNQWRKKWKGVLQNLKQVNLKSFTVLFCNCMYSILWLSFHGCLRLCACKLGRESQPILPLCRVFRVLGANSYYIISLDLCSGLLCYGGIITSLL